VSDLLALPVRDLVPATPRTRIVRLALGGRRYPYRAGQAVQLALRGRTPRKPYSIASAPEQAVRDDSLEFLVQITGDDEISHFADLGPGSWVDVEGPVGGFVFPDDPAAHSFLFVAGGTGIAPVRAMMWHALMARPGSRIGLFYSARSREEFAYDAELRGLAQEGRIQLVETVTRRADDAWKGQRGRLTRGHLGPLLTDPATLCFLCGPPALTSRAAAMLGDLGIPPAQIRMETWA
jgi:NAD(P)H-flavin reductase